MNAGLDGRHFSITDFEELRNDQPGLLLAIPSEKDGELRSCAAVSWLCPA